MVRIALATNDGKTISEGHFAHAKMYLLYDYDEETNEVKPVGSRENPLGNVPDTDDPEAIHEWLESIGIPMHGVEKYRWLHENVLKDVEVIIAGGACQTSYNYFTMSGVQLLFVEPGTQVDEIIKRLKEPPKEE